MTELTGGAHLARALKAEGITRVFGIPGTHNLEIFAQLSAHGIDIISPRHEQGAGYMADGAARTSGEVNVVVTTTGPAVLNALTALLQSFTDSVPVLLVCPGMPLAHPGRGNGLLHEVRNQAGALAAVLTEVHRVTSPGEVSLAVGQSLSAMRAGRTRPAAIEIPLDLIEATGPGSLHPSIDRPHPTADPQTVDTAAEAVADSLATTHHRRRRAHACRCRILDSGDDSRSRDHPVLECEGYHRRQRAAVPRRRWSARLSARAARGRGCRHRDRHGTRAQRLLAGTPAAARHRGAHRHRRSPDAHERPGDPPGSSPTRRRRRPLWSTRSGAAAPTEADRGGSGLGGAEEAGGHLGGRGFGDALGRTCAVHSTPIPPRRIHP